MLDFKQISLTRRMTVIECHHIGERLARAGQGLLKVAFVTCGDCVEPHAFVFTVAVNRGLRIAAFREQSEALSWLQAA